jgi:aerobic carbon-monoxide dehydrogenase medium subunit
MLLNLREYHRPDGAGGEAALDYVLDLLARPHVATYPLAGGDALVGSASPDVEGVVDLQGLGLDEITRSGDGLHLGALATRARLATDLQVNQGPYAVLARAAHMWGGSVQRNRATLGGTLACGSMDDALVTALLASDATVLLYGRSGYDDVPLAAFLAQRRALLQAPRLIVEVRVPPATGAVGSGLASIARTPADRPIVVVAAWLQREQEQYGWVRLAAGGVGPSPVRLHAAEEVLAGQIASGPKLAAAADAAAAVVEPPEDYRGSSAYRRAMVQVLVKRAVAAAWVDAA